MASAATFPATLPDDSADDGHGRPSGEGLDEETFDTPRIAELLRVPEGTWTAALASRLEAHRTLFPELLPEIVATEPAPNSDSRPARAARSLRHLLLCAAATPFGVPGLDAPFSAFRRLLVGALARNSDTGLGVVFDDRRLAAVVLPSDSSDSGTFPLALLRSADMPFGPPMSPSEAAEAAVDHEFGHIVLSKALQDAAGRASASAALESAGLVPKDAARLGAEKSVPLLDRIGQRSGLPLVALLAFHGAALASDGTPSGIFAAGSNLVALGLLVSARKADKALSLALSNFEESFADAWCVCAPLAEPDGEGLREAHRRLFASAKLRGATPLGAPHQTLCSLVEVRAFLDSRRLGEILSPSEIFSACLACSAAGLRQHLAECSSLDEPSKEAALMASVAARNAPRPTTR